MDLIISVANVTRIFELSMQFSKKAAYYTTAAITYEVIAAVVI